jgi:hypothetical protein
MPLLMLVVAAAACRGRDSSDAPPPPGAATAEGDTAISKLALRYHPPVGAVYNYAVTQRHVISIAGMGDQELGVRMRFAQRVKGRPASLPFGTELEVTFDSTRIDIPGVPAQRVAPVVQRIRGAKGTVVYDDRAQMMRSDFTGLRDVPPEIATQLVAGIRSMTFGFPEQPVGRGDSWTVATELPVGSVPGTDASAAGPARTTLTVRDIQVNGSDTTVVLDVKTAFPTGPIDLDLGGQKATMRISGTLTGDQQFSITRGTVITGTLKGAMKMNVTAAAMGPAAMVVTTNTESTVRLADTK